MAIKLEEGKYYKTRDGRKVGPMERLLAPRLGRFPFVDERDWAYEENGRFSLYSDEILDEDLIEEWKEEPVFKLEAGKYYKSRDGKKYGPLVRKYNSFEWFNEEIPNNHGWYPNGKVWYDGDDQPNDLIEEWTDHVSLPRVGEYWQNGNRVVNIVFVDKIVVGEFVEHPRRDLIGSQAQLTHSEMTNGLGLKRFAQTWKNVTDDYLAKDYPFSFSAGEVTVTKDKVEIIAERLSNLENKVTALAQFVLDEGD